MGKVKQNAERGDRNDTGSEKLQLKPGHAQFQFLGRDAVKPAQTGGETGEATSGYPWLWGYNSGQGDPEIVRQCCPPIWSEEPGLRQKTHEGAEGKS